MSSVNDPEYLDMNGAAELAGIKRVTFASMLSRGQAPEPDLIWLGKNLWLPDTIRAWRKTKHQRGKRRVKRKDRIKQPDAFKQGKRPPRLVSGNGASATRTRKRIKGANRPEPAEQKISIVDRRIAAEIARALRTDGHYVTTADVLELANLDKPLADYDRERLRQRIVAKIRGMRRQR